MFSAEIEVWSPGQTIATSQRNISQHCWPSICKLRPNDRNISMQQMATLLGATCCTSLATLLQRVSTGCELKIELVRMPSRNIIGWTWPNDYNIMQHPQMLHEKFDLFFKFEPTTFNMSQHFATRRNGVAKRTQPVASNNVAICSVEMLGGFWPGLEAHITYLIVNDFGHHKRVIFEPGKSWLLEAFLKKVPFIICCHGNVILDFQSPLPVFRSFVYCQ